jgi:hypothetical protein
MTIHCMLIELWVPRATKTHSVCVILIASPLQQCFNAPQCYVIRTLPVFVTVYCTNATEAQAQHASP